MDQKIIAHLTQKVNEKDLQIAELLKKNHSLESEVSELINKYSQANNNIISHVKLHNNLMNDHSKLMYEHTHTLNAYNQLLAWTYSIPSYGYPQQTFLRQQSMPPMPNLLSSDVDPNKLTSTMQSYGRR